SKRGVCKVVGISKVQETLPRRVESELALSMQEDQQKSIEPPQVTHKLRMQGVTRRPFQHSKREVPHCRNSGQELIFGLQSAGGFLEMEDLPERKSTSLGKCNCRGAQGASPVA
ncbi:hypothetical protein NDU88_000263, partial [Pleurodeles waltl]